MAACREPDSPRLPYLSSLGPSLPTPIGGLQRITQTHSCIELVLVQRSCWVGVGVDFVMSIVADQEGHTGSEVRS